MATVSATVSTIAIITNPLIMFSGFLLIGLILGIAISYLKKLLELRRVRKVSRERFLRYVRIPLNK